MSVVVEFPQQTKPAKALPRGNDRLLPDPLSSAVSGIIHDFNNLITGILLYAELLSHEVPDHGRSQTHVQQIRRAAENTSGLIRQLLAIARSEPQAPALQQASWNQSITEIRDLLQRMAGENIEIATNLASNLAFINFGQMHMQQILLNLVLNARDAMPHGGRILVQTRNCPGPRRRTTPFVELSITDTGMGMDAGTRARLFQPFQTTKKNGSGLGLYVIHRLVEQHNGRVQVETAPGKGTCIRIQLPRAVSDNGKSETQAKRL
jgi:two-component system, cell cycle sensor histidine kinase and response regulator CckA